MCNKDTTTKAEEASTSSSDETTPPSLASSSLSSSSSSLSLDKNDHDLQHHDHEDQEIQQEDDDDDFDDATTTESAEDSFPAGAPAGDILQYFPLEVVFLVEMYLPVQSLICLSAVNQNWTLHMSETHWHKIFDSRWSHCYESKHLTVSPSILSRLTGNYNSFWGTIEKAFMGDYSIVRDDGITDHASLFERVFKLLQPATDVAIPRIKYYPPCRSFPSINGSPNNLNLPSWKLACVLRDRSGNVLMGCRLCSQLDVFTEHMREVESSSPTQLRTWIVPCLCPALVHRRCLEARIKLRPTKPSGGGIGIGLGGGPSFSTSSTGLARGWISYDTAAHDGQEVTAEGSLGICARCGSFYVLGFRLPKVRELIAVTWQDDLAWKRAGDCILMWLMGVAIVSLSEALYLGRGDLFKWPKEGGHVLFWWMFQYVISLNIFLSPRFARIVDLIWLGPIFSFYARLYCYFLFATFFMLLSFTPLPNRICPWAIIQVPSWLFLAAAWTNFAVLFAITSIVIFLFWKTNYRIPTIADLRHPSANYEVHPMLSIGGA